MDLRSAGKHDKKTFSLGPFPALLYVDKSKEFPKGDALQFTDRDYYNLLRRASYIETIIADNWGVMAEYDPEHSIKLVVDEWGAWYGEGTKLDPSFNLSQQSTVRDALLSAITLDTFHRHCDKVAIATVAQTINCLNSLMLAREDGFTRTPVFYVFEMYLPHRGGQALRTNFSVASVSEAETSSQAEVGDGNTAAGTISNRTRLAGLSGSASMKGKKITLSVVNPHLNKNIRTEVRVLGSHVNGAVATVLCGPDPHAHNTFQQPNTVHSNPAKVTAMNGAVVHDFPPASITTFEFTVS
jgi:alpha-L-arabinofuranosidase